MVILTHLFKVLLDSIVMVEKIEKLFTWVCLGISGIVLMLLLLYILLLLIAPEKYLPSYIENCFFCDRPVFNEMFISSIRILVLCFFVFTGFKKIRNDGLVWFILFYLLLTGFLIFIILSHTGP